MRLWLFVLLTPFLCSAQTLRVVVIHSYHHGYKWTDDMAAGLDRTLGAFEFAGGRVELFHEYMDARRDSSPELQERLLELYRFKYAKSPPAAVVSTDDLAFRFLLRHGERIFKKAPIFFAGVNNLDIGLLEGRRNITGVVEMAELEKNVELIMRLHPETKRLVFVVDDTETGRLVSKEFLRVQAAWRGRVSLERFTDYSMEELCRALGGLGPSDKVLFAVFSKDRDGNFYTYGEAGRLVADASPVPVYGLWDFSLNNGVVGGFMLDGYQQGAAVAAQVIDYLKGKPVEEIAVRFDSVSRPVFDARLLKVHGIGRRDLPDDSRFINEPQRLWERHPSIVFWGAALIASISFMALMLLFSLRVNQGRMRKQTTLLKRYEHLRRERDLRQALLIRQSKVAVAGEVMAGIAHQWRQPLNLLGAVLYNIRKESKRGTLSAGTVADYYAQGRAAIDQLSGMIDDFRGLFRASSGDEVFCIPAEVAKALRMMEPVMEQAQIRVDFIYPRQDCHAKGARGEFFQVLIGLLTNAQEAHLRQKVADRWIAVECYTGDSQPPMCGIVIRDNAGGIPEEMLERIFEPNPKGKEAGGIGVGLYMAGLIIGKFAGRIWAGNEGAGAVFGVEVPAATAEKERAV
ncbi:MAG: ABC transporter substrate binding protein [Campylobacterales bacterium]